MYLREHANSHQFTIEMSKLTYCKIVLQKFAQLKMRIGTVCSSLHTPMGRVHGAGLEMEIFQTIAREAGFTVEYTAKDGLVEIGHPLNDTSWSGIPIRDIQVVCLYRHAR